jgi:hypothetical protein
MSTFAGNSTVCDPQVFRPRIDLSVDDDGTFRSKTPFPVQRPTFLSRERNLVVRAGDATAEPQSGESTLGNGMVVETTSDGVDAVPGPDTHRHLFVASISEVRCAGWWLAARCVGI